MTRAVFDKIHTGLLEALDVVKGDTGMTQHRYLIHPLFDHTVTVDDEAPRFHEHPEDTIARAAVEEAHTKRMMISRPAKREKAA